MFNVLHIIMIIMFLKLNDAAQKLMFIQSRKENKKKKGWCPILSAEQSKFSGEIMNHC